MNYKDKILLQIKMDIDIFLSAAVMLLILAVLYFTGLINQRQILFFAVGCVFGCVSFLIATIIHRRK